VAPRTDRWRLRARSSLRRLLWWAWPSHPTAWSEVPARLKAPVVQVIRLTVAAVVAYLVADALSPGILDLTAPLTALLVVQASTVGTVQMGLVRVGAVLTGVLVAVGVASVLGLSWWSLGLVIAASLVLANVLRLGEQSLETPISAMLILAVSSPELAAEDRVANTLVGTAVGIGFTLLVPVSIPNTGASDAVRRVARSQAALLEEVAVTLGLRPPDPEEVQAWSAWADEVESEADQAAIAVRSLEESRRLNPRALATAKVHPGLQAALARLDSCLLAVRVLLLAVGRGSPTGTDDDPAGAELRRAFAVLLDDLAGCLRAYGDLVAAEYGSGPADRIEQARSRMLDSVSETRAVFTELVLLDVRSSSELWMLQGPVVAAVDQVLRQLDLAHDLPRTEPWLARYAPALDLAAWDPFGGRSHR
jgi:uncharacterized membrane protein YccC